MVITSSRSNCVGWTSSFRVTNSKTSTNYLTSFSLMFYICKICVMSCLNYKTFYVKKFLPSSGSANTQEMLAIIIDLTWLLILVLLNCNEKWTWSNKSIFILWKYYSYVLERAREASWHFVGCVSLDNIWIQDIYFKFHSMLQMRLSKYFILLTVQI